MRAVAVPMADPQLEFNLVSRPWIPYPMLPLFNACTVPTGGQTPAAARQAARAEDAPHGLVERPWFRRPLLEDERVREVHEGEHCDGGLEDRPTKQNIMLENQPPLHSSRECWVRQGVVLGVVSWSPTVGALDKACLPEGPDPGGVLI